MNSLIHSLSEGLSTFTLTALVRTDPDLVSTDDPFGLAGVKIHQIPGLDQTAELWSSWGPRVSL